ncbi:hypothetical protein DYB32_008945 [Aphanomyces invadans]|uniref:HTH CENPB-type domain-containing protein n=1 Tax=Aphanomyces invadans TaxID=157072 RepID=A0A418AJR4_9STRA|nr:hypothetical protein DYB32_008945 [Aphanomyces invadans]
MVLSVNEIIMLLTLVKSKSARHMLMQLYIFQFIEPPLLPKVCFVLDNYSDSNTLLDFRFDVAGIKRLGYLLGLPAVITLEVAKDVGLKEHEFKASQPWITSFMKRWKLTMRAKTRSGQSNLERGQAALAEFNSRIRNLVATEDIEEIYNAEQTVINYVYIPKTTVDGAGSKAVWIRCSGQEKDRITEMLLADTKGTKYPMFLVLKSKASKSKEKVVENLAQ